MNKHLAFVIVLLLILIGSVGYYWTFIRSEERAPVIGKIRAVTIVAKEKQWRFAPEVIEAEKGDKIIVTLVNEDSFDHGLALDAFGLSQVMPAHSTSKVEFVVTQEGEFPFYCSIPCGEGHVDGHTRGHFDMRGKIHVRSIISETK